MSKAPKHSSHSWTVSGKPSVAWNVPTPGRSTSWSVSKNPAPHPEPESPSEAGSPTNIQHPKSNIHSCIMHLKENQTMSKGMDRKKETKKPKKKKP